MSYIRTKKGEIFTKSDYEFCVASGVEAEVEAEANSVPELIKEGDLIHLNFKDSGARHMDDIQLVKRVSKSARDDKLLIFTNGTLCYEGDVIELYTKQGNDYILVADTRNGKGVLDVL